jgi:alpha,alpha-trehalase
MIGGKRNWDYRFAWIRDSSLTLEALWVGSCSDEVENFVNWMVASAGGHTHSDRPLQIMYGVGGRSTSANASSPISRDGATASLCASATPPGNRPSWTSMARY